MLGNTILVLSVALLTSSTNARDLPPVVSFSEAATARIVRGDITLKGFNAYAVFLRQEAPLPENERLNCFHAAANKLMVPPEDLGAGRDLSDVLFMQAPSPPGSILRILAVSDEEWATAGGVGLIRFVDARMDPPVIHRVSIGELPCSELSLVARFEKIRAGGTKPVEKTESVKEFGDSIRSEPARGGGHLVAQEFQANVISPGSRDTFIFVYDPDCDVCVRSEPEWNNLRAELDHVKTLDLLMMDGSKNEVHGLAVKSYPSLFLFSAFDKAEPKQYKGARTATDMQTWLKKKVGMAFSSKVRASSPSPSPSQSLGKDTDGRDALNPDIETEIKTNLDETGADEKSTGAATDENKDAEASEHDEL